ncbi:hypothetical protein SAMN06265355_103552 [Actinomadura mexicana]|uniref:Calpain catalytic domain-containing protein n=1 Tax=Actinomadura mexicana TaxID=134959 RepID=A0A238X3J9_9ACTN|nr:hypothetical protein SAMN06265355_103552 [Actinomadura mexicana]
MENPTRIEDKEEKADRPRPPRLPPDNPGSPGQPSRLESLARSRALAQQENGAPQAEAEDSREESGPGRPEAQGGESAVGGPAAETDRSETDEEASRDERSEDTRSGDARAGQTESVGEKAEIPEESASSERRYTLPTDNPGSPNQPSRLESLARAREPVQRESRPQGTEAADTGSPPPPGPAIEPASPLPENGGPKAQLPQERGSSGQQDYKSGTDEPTPASGSENGNARDLGEVIARESASQPEDLPANDLRPGFTSESDGSAASNISDDVADDLETRISGEEPAADNGRNVDIDEDVLEGERGISDRLKQLAAKLDRSDEPKELDGRVDRPDFQDPREDSRYVPDRYGTPLDRTDGTRIPLFDGELAREQAEQGILGDCGVIATLGAVAEKYPEAIRNCVSETEDGSYEVRLHEAEYSKSKHRYEPTGLSIKLAVTPELPIRDKDPSKPAFAALTSTNVAWAPVLEKAIAGLDQMWSTERRERVNRIWKAQGKPGDAPTGYVRLNQGSNPAQRAELLTQLTGLPAKTVNFPTGYDSQGRSADRRLQDEIADHLSRGRPVLVGIRELDKDELLLPKRLVAGHAYEVTKVDDQGNFHLRNPWNDKQPLPLTVKDFKANIRPPYTTME